MKAIVVLVGAILALAAAAQASADPFVPSALQQAALAHPTQTFKVIVQGAPHVSSKGVAGDVQSAEHSSPGRERGLRHSFRLLNGVSAELTGRQITALSSRPQILAITPDAPLNANEINPPANLVAPSVLGTAAQDATLSALNGEWTGGTAPYGGFAYQWLRCDSAGAACVEIAGATGSTYVATAADVGATLAVIVTATDAAGVTATATSAASAPVQGPPPPPLLPPANITAPAVSGVAGAGETLTADQGVWQGAVPLAYGFQWQRCTADCTDIAGATAATYVVAAEDAGFALRVVVSAQDAAGSATAVSEQTAAVVAPAPAPPLPLLPPANVAAPSVSGVARAGETLTVDDGVWQGAVPLAYGFQWQRCSADCSAIAGATAATYVVAAEDVGFTLRAIVGAQDAGGSAAALSNQTATVTAAAQAPLNLSAPVVSGVAQAGETLAATTGQWQGGNGMTYGVQWQRCAADCTDIAGATGSTYDLTSADVGSAVRVVVTAQDATGSTSVPSGPSANVAPAPLLPPVSLLPPSVSGVARAGETLTATTGQWQGVDPATYSFQWQRCATGCSDIAGATAATYVVATDDVGSALRVVVTAQDATGSTSVASDQSTDVTPAPLLPPANLSAPSVSGVAQKGETLTAATGQWQGGDPTTYSVQWQRCSTDCVDIAGATAATYVLTAEDVGSTMRVVVTAQDANGSTSAPSAQTANVTSPPLQSVDTPKIAIVDGTATVDVGTWSGGVAPLSFTYSWQRCTSQCTEVATDSTYTLTAADAGAMLTVAVTATDVNGETASVMESIAVPRVVTPPANVDLPTIDQVYNASPGQWTGASIHYAYRWSRCDQAGANCADINGATTAAYAPVAADFGETLRVTVTATNEFGSASAVSAATPRVPPPTTSGYWNWQMWPYAAHADALWGAASSPPAIAVVDSGVDASLPGLDGTVSQSVTLTTLPQRAVADGYGHGSFVAQVAAGHAPGDAGAAPGAKIVSLDVMDDNGMAMTSDVIAAADWIYANASSTGIRVANFSLLGASPSSMQYDPLDKALEKLWFSGVVVVTAAGNFAVDGAESDAPYAPANDPFVITAGASDIAGTVDSADDKAAPWSAYGHTLDGFAKPEVSAPGRYVIENVPTDSTLYTSRSDRIVAPGQLQLSGTSFAAPIVSGIAANLLALHPGWTPDQVKGALMLTALLPGAAAPNSLGVGEVDAAAAAQVVDPPNPNAALDAFLVPDPSGGATPVFDTASWGTTVQADASWGTASWGTASWGTASWGTASWGTTYWSSASWGTASWGTASWGTTATPADNATDDGLPAGAYWMRWSR